MAMTSVEIKQPDYLSDENIEVAGSYKNSEQRFKSDTPYELQA
jgi:hypothetical protein